METINNLRVVLKLEQKRHEYQDLKFWTRIQIIHTDAYDSQLQVVGFHVYFGLLQKLMDRGQHHIILIIHF